MLVGSLASYPPLITCQLGGVDQLQKMAKTHEYRDAANLLASVRAATLRNESCLTLIR